MHNLIKFGFLGWLINFVAAVPCLINDASDSVYLFTESGDYKILDSSLDLKNPISLSNSRNFINLKCFPNLF